MPGPPARPACAAPRERVDHGVDALARHEAAELQHHERVVRPAEPCARRRPEFVRIEAARDDGDPLRVRAIQRAQIVRVLRALGNQQVGPSRERVLDRDARVGEAVGRALVQPPDASERMERDDQRDAEPPLHAQRDVARHEEVRVHQVDRCGFAPQPCDHVVRERAHVRQQPFPRHLGGRPGGDMDHADPRADRHDVGQVRIVAAGADVDVEPALRQLRGDARHADVLPAGIHATDHAQGRRMVADQRDSLHDGCSVHRSRAMWAPCASTPQAMYPSNRARNAFRRDAKITTRWMKARPAAVAGAADKAARQARRAVRALRQPACPARCRLDERRSR
ncbi:hypothetical protein WT15_12115 [Burkholderia stagnalis]|nr:hypothetical protein WT15_12115 [Burkholderia stagnalis]KWO28241.1 hypothetical protein WT95_20655 [Burkholderia stagnalis]KWO30795.1 hypothetical protein WT96_24180 [Burkholderia stagnalis]